MISIKVDAKGAVDYLEKSGKSINNSIFRALTKSVMLARKAAIDNIQHGSTKGLGWPPFKPSTIAYKAEHGRSIAGLVDSGDMYNRLQEKVSKSSMEGYVYPGVNYHKFHELGTRRMRKRETLKPVVKQESRAIEKIFMSEIQKGFVL